MAERGLRAGPHRARGRGESQRLPPAVSQGVILQAASTHLDPSFVHLPDCLSIYGGTFPIWPQSPARRECMQ